MRGTVLRQVRLEAAEGAGGWFIRVVLTSHDEEGFLGEPLTFTAHAPVSDVGDQLDQAWLVLLVATKMLENEGAVGRVAGRAHNPGQ